MCSNAIYTASSGKYGLCDSSLHTIVWAIVDAKLFYASGAWWGFTNASDRQKITAAIHRSIRSGFCLCSRSGRLLRILYLSWWLNTGLRKSYPVCAAQNYSRRETTYYATFRPYITLDWLQFYDKNVISWCILTFISIFYFINPPNRRPPQWVFWLVRPHELSNKVSTFMYTCGLTIVIKRTRYVML